MIILFCFKAPKKKNKKQKKPKEGLLTLFPTPYLTQKKHGNAYNHLVCWIAWALEMLCSKEIIVQFITFLAT
jgi:hypothetical protein